MLESQRLKYNGCIPEKQERYGNEEPSKADRPGGNQEFSSDYTRHGPHGGRHLFFKFPNNFSTGGVSGISILLGKLVPFLSPAVSMWVINLILLLIGFLFFGRGFGLMTAYCSMLYSFLTWLLK